MFYNELDVLELRLDTLDEWVDRFVLVEAEFNHSGGQKELFFEKNKERFSKWLHKIKHIILKTHECPDGPDNWKREKFQRECILRGIEDVPGNSIIMISDLDEIPDMNKIPIEALPHATCSVHMWMYEYSFKYLFTGESWFGTVITTCELVKSFGPNYFRENRWKFPSFKLGGWHLSSFGNGKNLANKVNTYAHSKDPHDIPWTEETFEELIANGIHTDGKTPLIKRLDGAPLPENIDLLKKLKFI